MMTPPQVEQFLTTLKNPRYYFPDEKGSIVLFGMFNGKELDFIASPTDPMEYGRDVFKRASEGFYGKIGPYVAPERPPSTTDFPNFLEEIRELKDLVEDLRAEIKELKGQ